MSVGKVPEIPAGFPKTSLLTLWCETPLHPGVGMVVKGGVDLPVQREKLTGLPMMQSSGIKGAMKKAAVTVMPNNELKALFGPEPESLEVSEYAGSMLLTDAHLLLFPVSSVRGMMCWVTSPLALARFKQSLAYVGKNLNVPPELNRGNVVVTSNSHLKVAVGNKEKIILIEEFELEVDPARSAEADVIVKWISSNAIPDDPSYDYVRKILPTRLAIVCDEDLRDITIRGVEILTRVRLTDAKVVESGGLWSEEHLSAFTVLYCSAFMPEKFRNKTVAKQKQPKEVFDTLIDGTKRVVLGGHETVGRGIVRIWRVR